MQIKSIKAREILDSRGNPTIEADIILNDGSFGRASVPSGASVGSREALELRDGGERYHGKGVLKAISNIHNIIAKEVVNKEFLSQREFDQLLINLDNTSNKSYLGANAILAMSLSFAKAMAQSNNLPLFKYLGEKSFTMPRPMVNIINGGAHADNALDIQEFMIIPIKYPNFREALRMSAEVFHTLKRILHDKGYSTNVGDEGGFAPNINSTIECLDLISTAIERSGYKLAVDFALGLDVAASEFYKDGLYHLVGESKTLRSDQLIEFYSTLIKDYHIISIEDPMSEHDIEGWKNITKQLGEKIQIVGDDLFVTNPSIFMSGIKNNLANAILIKLNQIGTLSETIETIKLAQTNHYQVIISHRSGETEDTTIAHLAVALHAGQIKTGSISRSDRLAKYNELLRIEDLYRDEF